MSSNFANISKIRLVTDFVLKNKLDGDLSEADFYQMIITRISLILQRLHRMTQRKFHRLVANRHQRNNQGNAASQKKESPT